MAANSVSNRAISVHTMAKITEELWTQIRSHLTEPIDIPSQAFGQLRAAVIPELYRILVFATDTCPSHVAKIFAATPHLALHSNVSSRSRSKITLDFLCWKDRLNGMKMVTLDLHLQEDH
ncbi:hypothetical protein C8J56DRAFT_1059361 [Mycena floridula]|nr:hypothetical protein C8J56DRAFT_1059361 [Mycena floridula]